MKPIEQLNELGITKRLLNLVKGGWPLEEFDRQRLAVILGKHEGVLLVKAQRKEKAAKQNAQSTGGAA